MSEPQATRRGPKPKPPAVCPRCQRYTKLWARGYCHSCDAILRRQGILLKRDTPTPAQLTVEQTDVLRGLMLGDGCLYRRKPTHTPYLRVQRMARDRAYLEWQAKLFREFMKRPIAQGEVFDERTGQTYENVVLVTRRVAVLSTWYEQWYHGGGKKLPDEVQLSPLTLAVWLADDGTVRPSCSPWRMKLKLSTHGFTWEDTERLAALLCTRLRESFHVQRSEGKPIIVAADTATRAFLKESDPVFPPGMERKTYWRIPEARFYSDQPPRTPVWGRYHLPHFHEPDSA